MQFLKTTIREFLNENHLINKGIKINSNFWKWFGDSKMKDNNGIPIIFYHCSNVNRRFSKFMDIKPIWFTKYEGYAKAFISGSGKLFSVFLKIENPLYVGEIDGIANDKRIQYLSELTTIDMGVLYDILKESNGVNMFNITNSERFKKIATDMGYDGLEAREGGGLITYAVFNTNQIKSITNNGNWDIENDNINS